MKSKESNILGTETNICLNWPGYSACDRIGIRKLPEYEDIWLCQSCIEMVEADEQRISQLNQIEPGE
jgi:hypothetical protein